ncbi:hypothetical protein [Streptomyces sp. NPDC055085]
MAFADLLLSSGMRLTEAASLLTLEMRTPGWVALATTRADWHLW